MKSQFLKAIRAADESPTATLLFLVLAHAGIQVGVLLLALFHVRLTPTIGLALLFGVGALATVACASAPAARSAREGGQAPALPWLWLLPAAGVGAYLLLFFRASSLPDYSWDGNTYHIPPINYWARAGFVHWVPVTPVQSELMNGYPKGAELLTWFLAKLLHAPRFVAVANLAFLPLGVVGIASLSEALGTSRRTAWAGGSLLIFVPVILWQGVTSYVDAAFGCAAIAALALLCRVRSEHEAGTVRWPSVVGLGSALGLVCALKGSGALLASVSLLGLMIATFSRDRKGALQRVAGAGAACALVGGYWYLRNYLHTGNPLYPVGLSFAGHPLFPGRKLAEVLDYSANTPALFVRWPGPLRVVYTWAQGGTRWPASSFGWDGRLGGLGFLWALGCVPASLAVLRGRTQRLIKRTTDDTDRNLWLLAAVVLFTFLGTPLNWWARYTLWIYALGLPCLALTLEHGNASSLRRTLRYAWLTGVVLLALTEGAWSMVQIARNTNPGDPAFSQAPAVREGVGEGCALFPEAEGTLLQRILLGNENVGLAPLSGDTEHGLLIGSLSLPLGARDVLPIPVPEAAAPDFTELHRRQVRYLIYEAANPLPKLPQDQVRSQEQAAGFWIVTLRYRSYSEVRQGTEGWEGEAPAKPHADPPLFRIWEFLH